jgi:hypothetical protein
MKSHSAAALIVALSLSGCGDDSAVAGGGSGAGSQGGDDLGGSTSDGGNGGTADMGGAGAGPEGGAGGGGERQAKLTMLDQSMPIDLTPDGSIALLQDGSTLAGDLYFYDLASGDSELQTSVGDALADFATGVSQDGRITALHGVPVQAGVYTDAGGWVDLDSPFKAGCDENIGGAWDVSADGAVTVGFMWNGCAPQAFRATDGDVELLDLLGSSLSKNGPVNRATVVSDDGSMAAGFAENDVLDRTPAIWNADGSGFLLDENDMDAPGEVLSINEDGSVVAGIWGNAGFRWTEQEGRVDLGIVPTALPGDPTFPNAMSADGSLVFGGCGSALFGVPVAFVWTAEDGMRALEDIAIANGITLPGTFKLTSVMAASADGSVLLGVAVDETNNQKSFVLELPASAY